MSAAFESHLAGAPRGLLPRLFQEGNVVVRESTLDGSGSLYVEEEQLLVGCVERRRREIIAGRTCAHLALQEIGIRRFPLLAAPNRTPVWPPNVVGSITHTFGCVDGYCGVAIADRRRAWGVGVDAEPRMDLPEDMWDLVLDRDERQAALLSSSPGIQARLVFSAKETTYKALYPMLGFFLQFSDVHIELTSEGSFSATLTRPSIAASSPVAIAGQFALDQDLLVTGMIVPPALGLPLAQVALTLHHVPC